jgi:hypothetical protein
MYLFFRVLYHYKDAYPTYFAGMCVEEQKLKITFQDQPYHTKMHRSQRRLKLENDEM